MVMKRDTTKGSLAHSFMKHLEQPKVKVMASQPMEKMPSSKSVIKKAMKKK